MKYIILLIFFSFTYPSHAQSDKKVIDTTEIISIGGIQQVINIKTADKTKPVLLYLHGSSGNSTSILPKADQLTAKLREHFIVVLWDQREYGKTLELNKSPQPISIPLLVNDTHEVIEVLLHKFNRKKLYIVGHSMGTVLGIHIAQKYPEQVAGFVAISPPVDGVESQKISLTKLKEHFKKEKNERAIKELNEIQLPTKEFEPLYTIYVWQTEMEGEHVTDEMREQAKPILKKWMETSGELYNQVYDLNFFNTFPEIKCPIYFFVGRSDYQTNATITEKYYKAVKASQKKIYWFEKSGHDVPATEPEKMQEIIINQLTLNK